MIKFKQAKNGQWRVYISSRNGKQLHNSEQVKRIRSAHTNLAALRKAVLGEVIIVPYGRAKKGRGTK